MTTLTPFFNQFSEEQIKAQYAANVKCFENMKKRSLKTGSYNGYTTEYLESKIVEYNNKAN